MKLKEVEKTIDEYCRNKNGRLEGQRLNEKYFKKHINDDRIICYFLRNDLFNSKSLYKFLNNVDDVCSELDCSSKVRFIGFGKGFKRFCAYHGKKNRQLQKVELKVNEVIDFIKVNSKYCSNRIQKLHKNTIELIRERTCYLEDVKFNERLYHQEHNLDQKIDYKFISSVKGYRIPKRKCTDREY